MAQKKQTGFNPLTFLQQVKTELGLVNWPTREETIRLTAIVCLVTIIFALYLGGLDYLFTYIMQFVI